MSSLMTPPISVSAFHGAPARPASVLPVSQHTNNRLGIQRRHGHAEDSSAGWGGLPSKASGQWWCRFFGASRSAGVVFSPRGTCQGHLHRCRGASAFFLSSPPLALPSNDNWLGCSACVCSQEEVSVHAEVLSSLLEFWGHAQICRRDEIT